MAELRLAIKNKKVVKTEVTQNVGSQLKSYNVYHEKSREIMKTKKGRF
jgi:hypothetical protein